MIEAGIFDNDYILIKQQSTANNGDIVVALIEDEATVRHFIKKKVMSDYSQKINTTNPLL